MGARNMWRSIDNEIELLCISWNLKLIIAEMHGQQKINICVDTVTYSTAGMSKQLNIKTYTKSLATLDW